MWNFIISATNKDNMLNDHKREVCFIGRSNVGKSSLINALAGQNALARTSNTPGRTQLINFFQEDDKMLVDLPGYGFAKMPKRIKAQMFEMIEEYFETRKQLVRTFVLVDAKIGATKDDIAMLQYLESINRPVTIVMTKADKAKQSEMYKNKKLVDTLSEDVVVVSSKKGKNIKVLRRNIEGILKG